MSIGCAISIIILFVMLAAIDRPRCREESGYEYRAPTTRMPNPPKDYIDPNANTD